MAKKVKKPKFDVSFNFGANVKPKKSGGGRKGGNRSWWKKGGGS
jgi:hypothetical protein